MFFHHEDLMRHEHRLREQEARRTLLRTVTARQARAERSLRRRERRFTRLSAQLARLRMARPSVP